MLEKGNTVSLINTQCFLFSCKVSSRRNFFRYCSENMTDDNLVTVGYIEQLILLMQAQLSEDCVKLLRLSYKRTEKSIANCSHFVSFFSYKKILTTVQKVSLKAKMSLYTSCQLPNQLLNIHLKHILKDWSSNFPIFEIKQTCLTLQKFYEIFNYHKELNKQIILT